MRSASGGWVLAMKLFTPSPKQRCATLAASGTFNSEPLALTRFKALATLSPWRVNCTAAASASSSRCRQTAAWIRRAKKAPIAPIIVIRTTTTITARISAAALPEPLRFEEERTLEPPEDQKPPEDAPDSRVTDFRGKIR